MTATAFGTRTDRSAMVRLRLIEGFELSVDGAVVEAPLAAQRLVAFLALHPRPLHRHYVAGSLWLDKTDSRATSNLRSALWRTPRVGGRLLRARRAPLRLAGGGDVSAARGD